MKIQATVVFQKNWEANKRIIVNQGSSRSSKTYSIAQKYILKLLKEKGKILSIVRKTSPALDLTVARDFFEILINWNLYDSKNHNKTLKTYNLNGNLVEFLGMDNPQKKRGAKRDYLWLNEANELSLEDWRQLAMRTTGEITLDFNPSDSFHWIYDDVMTREDCQVIKSTYRDNPFLPQEVIDEIERYKVLDPNFWRVFGLGERGISEDLIYTHWQRCETLPESYDRRYFGADWGFNNQTAIVEVREKDNVLYVQELLYQSGLNSDEIIRKLQELNIPRDAVIVGDSEDPGKINDIYMAGYNIKPAYKNKGSVIRGINAVKVKEIHITNTSINMIKELQFYRWQKNKDGQTMDMPIKVKDHCFIGSTLIQTNQGLKQIKNITTQDKVLTRAGYKQVVKRWDNGKQLVKEYYLHLDTNVIKLICTPEHKIYTLEKQWIPISELKSGMTISHIKNLTDNHISYIQKKDISLEVKKECIQKYGSFIMDKFQKIITSIIKIITLGITGLKIWDLSKVQNIYPNIANKEFLTIQNGLKHFKRKELRKLQNGIKVMKAENGIKNTVKKLGLIENIKQEFVKCVVKNTKQDTEGYPNFAIQIAKLKHLEEGGSWNEQVYDLTVENQHEYFANGILVHNCMDAMRYCIDYMELEKATDGKIYNNKPFGF